MPTKRVPTMTSVEIKKTVAPKRSRAKSAQSAIVDEEAIARAAYERFVRELRPMVSAVTADSTDEESYAARFRLVHAWRTFLFSDPQLPESLLPPRWPGSSAATFFDRHAGRLRPAADRYVDLCLEHSSRSLAARHLPRTPMKGVAHEPGR